MLTLRLAVPFAATVAALSAVFGAAIVARFAARSPAPPSVAASPIEIQTWKSILYRAGGDAKLNGLDIYAPKNAQKCPVVVFIHGGGWSIGDKNNAAQAKAEAFGRQDYVFVSINYRLAPAVKHPIMEQDVASALAWVHKNIASYHGDPARVFVMGHSAGAHLAALVSTDERYLKKEGLGLDALSGTILLDSASYDLTAPRVAGEEMNEQAFGTDPAVRRDASPLFHVATGKNIPPFLLIHIASRAGSKKQSHTLADALTKAGVKADVVSAAGKTHATVNRDFGAAGDAPSATVFAFLARVTGKPNSAAVAPAESGKPIAEVTVAGENSKRDLRRTLQELNLTPEQKTKARALLTQYGGDRRNAAFRKAFAALLTPEQKRKLAR